MKKFFLTKISVMAFALVIFGLVTCGLTITDNSGASALHESGAVLCCGHSPLTMAHWHDVADGITGAYLMPLWLALVLLMPVFSRAFTHLPAAGKYAQRLPRNYDSAELFDILQRLLRQGILHPKVF